MEIILKYPIAKYLSDFHDNRDMKTLNTKLIVPFVITLLLTGCMPDSLTKFKKDEPTKKVTASTTTGGTGGGGTTVPPVVDETGAPVVFNAPTYFTYEDASGLPKSLPMGTNLPPTGPFVDGSLGDSTKEALFFERCDLDTTGVNAQAVALPAGISFDTASCEFKGTPTTPKSVMTAFCSDGVSIDQATCEANPLVWSGTACSLPDFAYASAATCSSAFHKWYAVGAAIPYRVKVTYHDASGTQHTMYAHFRLGTYRTLTTLNYTQSDKLLLKVTGTGSYANITPLLTTTATVGAYARANMIVSNTDVAGVAKVVDPMATLIGVNKLIPLKVASTTPFIVNTFITKQGDSTKVGKIFKIDAANRIIYVENISADNKTFIKLENICSNNITGACATSYAITDISESYTFKKAQTLDNDKQYYSPLFTIDTPTNVFEVGSSIKPINPIATAEISTNNAITYSISPALPCNDPTDPADCISLDSTTGVISGTFTSYLANTIFTVTATNPIGSVSTIVSLGAIVGPNDLALTNKQIITVSSTAFFLEGETLYQPIAPPLTEALNAKIVKVLNPYQLAVETFNGEFSPGASLDNNGSAFKSEKAVIIPYDSCTNTFYTTKATCEAATFAWAPSKATHYNIALTTNATGVYVAGDAIASAAGTGTGAVGLVAHVLTAANDVLFIQYLTGNNTSTAGAKTFYEGDTLNLGSTVTQVESTNMKFTLASAAGFSKGSDLVTSANTAAYIYNITGNVISSREISRAAGGTLFQAAQTVYNHETQALSTSNSTINASSVTFDNFFVFERGKNMTLKGNVSSGNGIIYSITPALPAGLTLNTLTGSISGSATSISAKKDYLITGANFIGTTTYVISIEVKDYFEIQEKSGASSFLLHKVGDYQNNRKCRVDSSDILSLTNAKALDIRCFLDGEEQDVYQSDVVYKAISGAGICEYVQYSPYYFNSFSPVTSFQTSTRYPTQAILRNGCSTELDQGTMPTADQCEGNYSHYDNTYPNCDEGSLAYWQETYDGSTCLLVNRVQKTVECGGKKAKCIAGPVRSLFSDTQIESGLRSQIMSASAGIEKTYTHVSPISKGDSINVRNANGTVANQCSSGAADALTWKAKAVASNIKTTPMGADSNPYYTFTCLNAAYEIKARIRVVVRDWDETFKINNNIYNQSFTAPASNE